MAWKTSVLVVANVTATSQELLDALTARAERGPVRFELVVPATPFGGGREAAMTSLFEAVDQLRAAGLEAEGTVGNPDPIVAVSEIWDPEAIRRDHRLDAADEALEVAPRRAARADRTDHRRACHASRLAPAEARGADRAGAGDRGPRSDDGPTVSDGLGRQPLGLTERRRGAELQAPSRRRSRPPRPCDN